MLFGFVLHLFTNGKRLKKVFFMQWVVNRKLLRVIEQRDICVSFTLAEKYLIAALYGKTKHAPRFFSLVTPKTILTVWKHILSGKWTHKHKKSGRPPLSKDDKEVILKMKKENPL